MESRKLKEIMEQNAQIDFPSGICCANRCADCRYMEMDNDHYSNNSFPSKSIGQRYYASYSFFRVVMLYFIHIYFERHKETIKMIDAISFLWDALLECGFSMWMRGIIVIVMLCCVLLIRELARQRGDNHAEYNEIMRGYRDLHKSQDLSEQCLAEVSALNMIKNGGYDPGPVLEDVERHFDTYFSLPLPARFIVLQSLPRPDNLTPEQEELYEKWTPRLIEYAEERAMADLALYEKQLSSDCVNERCWVMLQRIDFLRRGTMHYDGRKVLQWMEEIKRIHQESGQLSAEMTAELQIVQQYHEMILFQQLEADQETFGHMREYLADAYKKAKQLPTLLICASLIDIAYFGLILEDVDLAREAIDHFRNTKQSPRHFSSEVQHKLEVVEQYFADVSQK